MNVLIAGGDPTAAQLASLLVEQNHRVRLVEHRREVLSELHQELPSEVIYEDKATDLSVLENAGIRSAAVFVACMDSDADNLALCHVAQTVYHVRRTIGRINNPRHAWLFSEKMHVDIALNESAVLAHLISEEMSFGDMLTLLKLRRGQYSLMEVIVPQGAKAVGVQIKDLPLPAQCVIAGIIRKGQMIVPRGITAFAVDDEVLALTDPTGAAQLLELFSQKDTIQP